MPDSSSQHRDALPQEREAFAPGESISPAALADRMRNGSVQLIDVRTPAEFRRVHAQGATNVPLDRLDAQTVAPVEPVYVICRGGARSREAADRLRQAMPGCSAVVVEGGTLAWIDAGLAVARGRRTRRPPKTSTIVVGVIFVVSGALAIFVHRGLLGLAGLAAAWVVAINTLDPRQWTWRHGEEITESPAR